MAKWKIEIPGWHPTTLNKLMNVHWAVRGRMKAQDASIIKRYAEESDVPPADKIRVVTLTYIIKEKSRAKFPDEDNIWKSPLDALKHAKMIVDDSPDWLKKNPVVYLRAKEKGTIIELEDVA